MCRFGIHNDMQGDRERQKKFRYDIRLASMSRSEKKNERENKIRNNAD